MTDFEKKSIPDLLKWYNYEEFKKGPSSDLHKILDFFSNWNFKLENSEFLNEITDIQTNFSDARCLWRISSLLSFTSL